MPSYEGRSEPPTYHVCNLPRETNWPAPQRTVSRQTSPELGDAAIRTGNSKGSEWSAPRRETGSKTKAGFRAEGPVRLDRQAGGTWGGCNWAASWCRKRQRINRNRGAGSSPHVAPRCAHLRRKPTVWQPASAQIRVGLLARDPGTGPYPAYSALLRCLPRRCGKPWVWWHCNVTSL